MTWRHEWWMRLLETRKLLVRLTIWWFESSGLEFWRPTDSNDYFQKDGLHTEDVDFNITGKTKEGNMKIKAGISRYIVTQSKKETFEDDYVTKTMGAFGNYQSLVCSISVIARMISSCNIMSIVFLTSKTEFVCTRFKDGFRRVVENSTCYDDCVQYKYNSLVFDETLISTFGLICDRAWLSSFTQTITMFGLALGVAILGWCSDRFGRRIAFMLSASICVFFMIAAPFVSNYSLYNAFRFFAGFGSGGIMAINVVYNIEIVGSKYRETAGSTGLIADGLAIMFLAVVAHYTSKWQTYLLILGLVSGMILILMLFIPETPRWLIAQRKKEQAIQLLTKIATFNRLETSHISETVSKVIEELETVEVKKQTYLDLFNNRKITKVTIVYAVIWTLGGICYFGITHYSTLLGLNIFVMVPLMGFLQIIGNIIAIPVNKYLGRKISVICNLLLVAAMMTILIFIPDGHWGCAVTSGIATIFSICAFCVFYLHVNELYPTPLRNMGVGVCCFGSKVGAMVAPFIANMQPHWMSSTIFAVLPFLGAVLAFLLPETKGKKMEDTI